MKIKKRDVLIIISLLLLSLLMAFFVQKSKSNIDGDYLLVELNGKEYGKYPLDEDKTFKVNSSNDEYNIVEIKDGKVNMKDANCRDLICTQMPEISKDGETIVCLPHRLILEVVGSEKNEEKGLDTVVGWKVQK